MEARPPLLLYLQDKVGTRNEEANNYFMRRKKIGGKVVAAG